MKLYFKRILVVIMLLSLIFVLTLNNKESILTNEVYISGESNVIDLYDKDYKVVTNMYRGTKVLLYRGNFKNGDDVYKKIKYDGKEYFIKKSNISNSKDEVVKEKELYVRTNTTLYIDGSSSKILSLVKKGTKLEIKGYDYINEDGSVNRYKVLVDSKEGYVYSKYLVKTKEESLKVYDENNIQSYMEKMGDKLGGGNANNLDYYPYNKPKFENNVMPNEVRAIYINAGAVKNIEDYIEFAKESNINAFVIDIKDNTSPAYNSPVMKEYSKTNYDHALNDFERYKEYIKKARDAGIYLIGRITVFKDSYYVNDHIDAAIKNSNGTPFSHNGSYWPSAYNRGVWEFNVELAKEAVKEVGFNEIQFDYVRFPDKTTKLEREGVINLNNTYNEEKAQVLQTFVMYACDEIHKLNAYVSIDVFGESAYNYVTAYGQFWAALSNVADVISGMPYPDHFNTHDFGIKEVVWTVPYKLLDTWSKYVVTKQTAIPTPAIVRTWIQAYDIHKTPNVEYDSEKVSDEIRALYDNGLKGGYMTWNSASNLVKYKEISDSFKKVY